MNLTKKKTSTRPILALCKIGARHPKRCWRIACVSPNAIPLPQGLAMRRSLRSHGVGPKRKAMRKMAGGDQAEEEEDKEDEAEEEEGNIGEEDSREEEAEEDNSKTGKEEGDQEGTRSISKAVGDLHHDKRYINKILLHAIAIKLRGEWEIRKFEKRKIREIRL